MKRLKVTFPIIAMLLIASTGCERRAEQLSGLGKIRSPQGNWKIELLDKNPGLQITEIGKDTSPTSPVGWTNTAGAFVFVDPAERIWAFDGASRTFIFEKRSTNHYAAWDLAGCKHAVPEEFLKRLPSHIAAQARK